MRIHSSCWKRKKKKKGQNIDKKELWTSLSRISLEGWPAGHSGVHLSPAGQSVAPPFELQHQWILRALCEFEGCCAVTKPGCCQVYLNSPILSSIQPKKVCREREEVTTVSSYSCCVLALRQTGIKLHGSLRDLSRSFCKCCRALPSFKTEEVDCAHILVLPHLQHICKCNLSKEQLHFRRF